MQKQNTIQSLYQERDWRYFPIVGVTKNGRSAKRPACKNPKSYNMQIENGQPYAGIIPDDVVVVDIDTRNGGTIDNYEFPATFSVKTPGGWHYYYTKPSDAKIRKSLSIFPGFDFLTKWVTMPPSTVDGKKYTVIDNGYKFNEFSPLPDFLYDHIVFYPSEKTQQNSDDEYAKNISIAELNALLLHIPESYADGYDSWISIGMSLHHATQGSDDGLELYNNWSQTSEKYQEGDAEVKWSSFNSDYDLDRPITVNTLYALALQNGYVPRQEFTSVDDVEKLPRNHAITLTKMLAYYYFNEATNECVNTLTQRSISTASFNRIYTQLTKKSDSLKHFLQEKLINTITDNVYKPGGERIIEDYDTAELFYNTYRESSLIPLKGDVTHFINHLKRLLPHDEQWKRLRDWMAFIAQNPHKPVNFCMLIIGDFGIGKGYLSRVMQAIVGLDNFATVKNDALTEKHNGWIEDATLVLFDEIHLTTGRDQWLVYEKLKSIITDKYLSVRSMQTDVMTKIKHFSTIMFSNHAVPIKIPHKDRRFEVYKSFAAKLTPEEKRNLWTDDREVKNIQAIYHYLLNDVDVSNYNNHEPLETQAKQVIIEESLLANQDFDLTFFTPPLELFSHQDLLRMTGQAVSKYTMTDHYERVKRIFINSKQILLYTSKQNAERFYNLSPAELKRQYALQLRNAYYPSRSVDYILKEVAGNDSILRYPQINDAYKNDGYGRTTEEDVWI